MAIARLVSIGLRTAELVFACIVAGVTGDYLHKSNASSMSLWRFIYTVTVAGISILLSLLWLIPFSSTFVHWPIDFFISILWWISFGVLVNVSGTLSTQYNFGLLTSFSSSETTAVPSSTGAMCTLEATSAASSRPILPLLSCRPCSGLCLLLLDYSGCASGRSVRSRSIMAIVAGIAVLSRQPVVRDVFARRVCLN